MSSKVIIWNFGLFYLINVLVQNFVLIWVKYNSDILTYISKQLNSYIKLPFFVARTQVIKHHVAAL